MTSAARAGDAWPPPAGDREVVAIAGARGPTEYTLQATRRAKAEADLKELDFRRRMGELVTRASMIEASTICGEVIVRDLEDLAAFHFAEELTSAAHGGKVAAVHAILKRRVLAIRSDIAERLRALGADTPSPGETDDDVTGDAEEVVED